MTKITTLLLLAVLSATQACGKGGNPEGTEAESDSEHGKMELKWLNGAEMEKARKLAKKENKKILLEFTGSDWCPPCIKLHNEVLVTKEFGKFAKENLVLVKLDFPRRPGNQLPEAVRDANSKLQSKFGAKYLPTIVLLGKDGETLGKIEGYAGGGPKAFIKKLKGMKGKEAGGEQSEG